MTKYCSKNKNDLINGKTCYVYGLEDLILLLLSHSVVSNSVRPHRRQPTRLPRPWDSPGKNTGVDCHFLLQCMKVKSESEIARSCLTVSDPMDCSLPGSSIHGILQARILEWGAMALSNLYTYYPVNSWRTWTILMQFCLLPVPSSTFP